MEGWDGMDGWDGSPGGPRYRAPTVLIKYTEANYNCILHRAQIISSSPGYVLASL